MSEMRHVGRRVNILSHKITRRIDNVVAPYGVTAIQSKIMGYIFMKSQSGDVFQKDVEAEFDIRRSSVTSVMKLMEKNGLIKRVSVAYDGRLKKLVLTDKAMDIHKIVWEEIQKVERVFTEELSPEQLDFFCDALKRLSIRMEE